MAEYLGATARSQTYFAKEWSRLNLTHDECTGIWIKILSTIFCFPNDHPFQIKPQSQQSPSYVQRHHHTNIKPVWVLFDDEGTIAVIEVHSAKESMNWGSIQGQAYNHITSLRKRSQPTIGIIAQGDKFICWEQTIIGSDGQLQCMIPRKLFPIRGNPASVVEDSEAVQEHFEAVRMRAKEGEFGNY